MYIVPMREEAVEDGVSVIARGAIVLSESVIRVRGFLLTYRLSIEPHLPIRGKNSARYYTVTVEKQKNGVRTRALLRDFTERFPEAMVLYHRLVRNAVFPEHLSDVYEDTDADE